MIKKEVIEATSSMTAVPKPLKFLTTLYKKITETYEKYATNDTFKVSALCFVNQFSQIEKTVGPYLRDWHGCCS
jgi:N-acetyl-anhydromuramyl-L-alanine amidase AmpD